MNRRNFLQLCGGGLLAGVTTQLVGASSPAPKPEQVEIDWVARGYDTKNLRTLDLPLFEFHPRMVFSARVKLVPVHGQVMGTHDIIFGLQNDKSYVLWQDRIRVEIGRWYEIKYWFEDFGDKIYYARCVNRGFTETNPVSGIPRNTSIHPFLGFNATGTECIGGFDLLADYIQMVAPKREYHDAFLLEKYKDPRYGRKRHTQKG